MKWKLLHSILEINWKPEKNGSYHMFVGLKHVCLARFTCCASEVEANQVFSTATMYLCLCPEPALNPKP